MDFSEIKNKPESELRELLAEAQAKIRDLRFSAHEGQLKNVREFRATKKLIARIQTLLAKVS